MKTLLFLLFIIIILIIVIIRCQENFNIDEINFQTELMNNRGIAQICDKKMKLIKSDNDNLDIKYFDNIRKNDIIFLTTNMFGKFLKKIILDKPVIIILSCSDIGFPNELSKDHNKNYLDLIENNKYIKYLYTSNYDINTEHYKIKPIILGIDYHGKSTNPPHEQEHELKKIFENSLPFDKRINKTYSFFHYRMFEKHGRDRFLAYDFLKQSNFNDFQEKKFDRIETWKNMINYKWIISPHGNGLDCHRTYEAIALGCIPIVRTSTLDILYKNLPIIIVNNWNDLSLEFLNIKTEEALTKSSEMIKLNFWKNEILAKKNNMI